jgi:hypothetical protein
MIYKQAGRHQADAGHAEPVNLPVWRVESTALKRSSVLPCCRYEMLAIIASMGWRGLDSLARGQGIKKPNW